VAVEDAAHSARRVVSGHCRQRLTAES